MPVPDPKDRVLEACHVCIQAATSHPLASSQGTVTQTVPSLLPRCRSQHRVLPQSAVPDLPCDCPRAVRWAEGAWQPQQWLQCWDIVVSASCCNSFPAFNHLVPDLVVSVRACSKAMLNSRMVNKMFRCGSAKIF